MIDNIKQTLKSIPKDYKVTDDHIFICETHKNKINVDSINGIPVYWVKEFWGLEDRIIISSLSNWEWSIDNCHEW